MYQMPVYAAFGKVMLYRLGRLCHGPGSYINTSYIYTYTYLLTYMYLALGLNNYQLSREA
jgi:hypothetical protein